MYAHMCLQNTRCHAYCTHISIPGLAYRNTQVDVLIYYVCFNQLSVCVGVCVRVCVCVCFRLVWHRGGNKITFRSLVERTSVVVGVVDSRIRIFIKKAHFHASRV